MHMMLTACQVVVFVTCFFLLTSAANTEHWKH